tara:strand:+ start:1322 stop:1564 length:243 start_codon:yes stop_codon:yes gene_type:complete
MLTARPRNPRLRLTRSDSAFTPAAVLTRAQAEVLVAFTTPARLTAREGSALCRNEATLMTFIFPCGFLVAARVGIKLAAV